jgi:predicted permease
VDTIHQLWARVTALFERDALDRDFDEEARTHIDIAADDYIQRGYQPGEARRLAHVQFGATEAAKDAHRDSRGLVWLDGVLHDLRDAWRGLAGDPMYSLAAIVILSLAIALNATAFRVVDGTLLRGYSLVKQNDRMVFVDEIFPNPGCCVSYMDFEAWRAQAHSFQDLAFGVPRAMTVGESADRGRDIWAVAVTANAFHALGVQPKLGREFSARDEVPGSPPVVIVSYGYWLAHLGGRAGVIGHSVFVNGAPATIVGLMPEGFDFPGASEVWVPVLLTPDLHTTVANGGYVFGRLKDGASEAAARTEVETINARRAVEFPATNRGVRPVVTNFMKSAAGPNGRVIYGSLWAGALIVLGIAWGNLTNLALARAQGRLREISTRMALGAGRGRVVREWLMENLLLAVVAGVLGWWASAWSIRLWAATTVTAFESHYYTPSLTAAIYVVLVTLLSALLITAAPMSRLGRLDLNGALKGEPRGGTMGLSARRLSAALVTGQMALAIALMSGAGVLGHSLWNVLTADIGVRSPETILVGQVALPRGRYPSAGSRIAFFNSLDARLAAIPGVTSAAVASGRPADDFEPRPVELEGALGSIHGAPVFPSGPGYFRTIGAPILAGREFNATDGPESSAVALVNRIFAETYFPGQNAVGRRIRLYEKRNPSPGQWRTIVGVVSNVMQNDVFRRHLLPVIYVPFAQEPRTSAWFFARVPFISDGLAAAVRAQAGQMNPGAEVTDFATLKTSLGIQYGKGSSDFMGLSKNAIVAPVFAALALLLAATGLYSVVSRSAIQRTKEIGVRMALGASARKVERLMLREAMTPVALGLVLGLVASLAVNRILHSQLVGVSPYDAPTLVVAPLVLILVALIASARPVRRASRIDPAGALRHD